MKFTKVLLTNVLVLSLAACGNNDGSSSSNINKSTHSQGISGDQITFTDDLSNKIVLDHIPTSVATLNPGMMDILLELGANVTGRPTITGEMTDEVESIQELGNPHEPSFEQIVATNPELLIVPESFMQFASTIQATGIKIAYSDMNSIDDIRVTIEKYGELFDATEKADELVAEMDAKIDEEAVESTLDALIVYGAPGTYLAALDSSLYGDILAKSGGNNIASKLPELDKFPSYANLSAEKIVEGNPQIIMIITHSNPKSVKSGFEMQMSQNPAWKNLDAVKNNQIVFLPADLFDNPGTQVIKAIEYMKNLLNEAEAAAK